MSIKSTSDKSDVSLDDECWFVDPVSIASSISNSSRDRAVVAKLDRTPFEYACFLTMASPLLEKISLMFQPQETNLPLSLNFMSGVAVLVADRERSSCGSSFGGSSSFGYLADGSKRMSKTPSRDGELAQKMTEKDDGIRLR